MNKYLQLAREQFSELMENTLDKDRHIVCAENKQDYDIDNEIFTIRIDGCWEKSVWFDWVVTNEQGEKIDGGCFDY